MFTVGCSNNGETFDITLGANGGLFRSGEDIYQIKDTRTSEITLPSDPTKDGFVFIGWFFDDQTFSNPFSLDELAEKDSSDSVTIYAKWEIGDDEPIVKIFTITFETNGGTSISLHCYDFLGHIGTYLDIKIALLLYKKGLIQLYQTNAFQYGLYDLFCYNNSYSMQTLHNINFCLIIFALNICI